MASTDARPVPQKNVAYRITFPIFDADGDPVTGASGLDSEVSKDAGTFADCTNEATEIATSSGIYYLDLTSAEMNADTVAICVKTSTSGAKTTVIVLYPEETGDIRVNATAMGGTTLTARDIGASVLLSSGTGTGQVTLTSGRVNADITHIATAAVSTSTAQLGVNVVNFGGSAGTFASGRPEVNTTHAAGTAWGSGAITAASIAAAALNGKGDWNVGKTGYSLTVSPLDAAGVRAAVGLASANLDTQLTAIDDYLDTEVAAIKAKTDNLPSDPADASDIASSFSTVNTKLDTIDDLLDTEVAAIKAVTDKIDTALELDSTVYRFTVNALENAPSGGGGGLDAAGVRAAIGLASANLDTQLTAIDDFLDTEIAAIKAKTDNLPSDPADASDISTAFGTVNTKLDAIDDFLDTEIAAIKAKTDNLPASPAASGDIPAASTVASAVRTELGTELGRIDVAISTRGTGTALDAAGVRAAVGLASANLDTQIADIPTVSEFEARTIASANYATAANLATIISHLTDVKGATFSGATDSLEAIRDRGDSAWSTATSVTVSDKTGFKLASDGLDSIATTAPTGVAANFREMLVQVWRRFFKKTVKSATEIKTYADNGSTVLTTQTISESGDDQTLGASS